MNNIENLDRFVQERMLQYCRDLGLSYYESVSRLKFTAEERSGFDDIWLD